MRKYFAALVLALLAVSVLAVPVPAFFDIGRWPEYCQVEPGDASKEYALAELSGPVADAALDDLRDLRVVQDNGGSYGEVAYELVTRSNVPREVPVKSSLLDRGTTGKNSTATVYLGASVLTHNHLRINTGKSDFIKDVILEGSDDRLNWVKINNSGKIAAFTEAGQLYRQTDVTYDPAAYRYLRVTLTGGTKETVDIDGIDVFDDIRAADEKSVDMKIISKKVNAKVKDSIIVLTTGYRNFPVHRLELGISSVNFSRTAFVYGSEDQREWYPVGNGNLASFRLANYNESRLSLPVNSRAYRYLKVVIKNGDSAPLSINNARGYYYPRYILFPCQPGINYSLYFGNRAAAAPRYDLSEFAVKILETNPPVWRLSSPKPNPLYKAKPQSVPRSEQYKWLLPGIMAVLVAGLSVIIILAIPKVMKGGE